MLKRIGKMDKNKKMIIGILTAAIVLVVEYISHALTHTLSSAASSKTVLLLSMAKSLRHQKSRRMSEAGL